MRNLGRFEGCLIGGAAGDALGYRVEFNDAEEIFAKYGKEGITEFELYKGKALVSDDTQMSLFTGCGLLLAAYDRKVNGSDKPYEYYINCAYKDWYRTQIENYPLDDGKLYTWLPQLPELFADRAAGTSCRASMRRGGNGSIENPINDSKGCGGIMRVAPIALYFIELGLTVEQVDMIAARVAALTHGHPLGYIPAAALTHLVFSLAYDEEPNLREAIEDMKETMKLMFPQEPEMDRFIGLIELAVELAGKDLDDQEAIHKIGEGWVAEETLAVAIYCALKYDGDFEKAIVAAVNHRGDSDSTGAVTGNIVGAQIGLPNIPEKFVDDLEMRDTIIEMADDLYYDHYERVEEEGIVME